MAIISILKGSVSYIMTRIKLESYTYDSIRLINWIHFAQFYPIRLV